MTSATPLVEAPVHSSAARKSFLIVFFCTFIGALAQVFIKLGARGLHDRVTLIDVVHKPTLVVVYALQMISNPDLFFGYFLLGIMTVLIAMALKGRELSRLYPIIALTYVWVTALSIVLFHEHMNFFRVIGIVFIIGGVSILGMKK